MVELLIHRAELDFKNTIIILTSNLGSSFILDGIQPDNTISDDAKSQVENLLKTSFRPEFLNRLDEIVFYKPLAKSEIGSIVDLMLKDLNKRIAHKQISIDVSDSAKQYIIDRGYDPVYGARPLRRAIQRYIEDEISEKILRSEIINSV